MVAWCQESDGSIPQSQLLQVRPWHVKGHVCKSWIAHSCRLDSLPIQLLISHYEEKIIVVKCCRLLSLWGHLVVQKYASTHSAWHLLITFIQCCYSRFIRNIYKNLPHFPPQPLNINTFFYKNPPCTTSFQAETQTFVICTFSSSATVLLKYVVLLQNFLNSSSCPEIQGYLSVKEPGRRSWRKLYMFLRRSGLYYSTKGTSKVRIYSSV